ncbi:uncharacterized protein LOC131668326 [Phymastichus coffea]|uniref:uncharacterized protein LOC131668326 n=1 Tax=Phymastichus coffea TaxID=108790 RepID=UPI00273C84FA|nr:uncharacterized protein LOC131668326 [Phymastichus coffea]XP_058798384.1 uncharacterized protein LOC131668326 [Phymastichus coffea]
MKSRSLSGNVGIGTFMVGFICIIVGFSTASWLTSDPRIVNAKMDQLGLWRHCFRSLPNPAEADAPRRFFVGCRWVYDPFTTGYSEIRGYLLPPFMVTTQFFFTLCFLSFLISLGLIVLYSTCWDQEHKNYINLITAIGSLLLFGSICGCIAVIVFALFGNTDGWMPGHSNNFFGYSFIISVIGSIIGLIASALFFIEANIQKEKRKDFKESQTKFSLEARA